MDRRLSPHLYASLQEQEHSTSLVIWEDQEERGPPWGFVTSHLEGDRMQTGWAVQGTGN